MSSRRDTGTRRRSRAALACAGALAALVGGVSPGHTSQTTTLIECAFAIDASAGMLNFSLIHEAGDEWIRSARDAPVGARRLSGTFADGATLPGSAALPETGDPIVFSLHDMVVHLGVLSVYPGGHFMKTLHESHAPGDAEARSGSGNCWMVTY